METVFSLRRFVSFLLMIWIQIMRLDCSVIYHRGITVQFSSNCQFIQDIFVCDNVPVGIPKNITSVVITAFKGDHLYNKFKNTTWEHVKKLNLKGSHVTDVDAYAFATLPSLTELILHLPHATWFNLLAFEKLSNLSKLELLDIYSINSKGWLPALTKPMPDLDTLTFNPGVSTAPPTIEFSTETAEALVKKGLQSLNFTNSLIILSHMAFLKSVMSPQLEVLNISGSTFSYFSPNGRYSSDGIEGYTSLKKRPLLKTLDASRCIYSAQPFEFNGDKPHMQLQKHIMYFMRYLMLIETLYADNIYHDAGRELKFEYYKNIDNPLLWKTLSLRRNNITTVIGKLWANTNNTVYSLDMSENTIVYIQPDCLSTVVHLRYLNLSRNLLYKMQNNKEEFQSLFQMQSELIKLDLSYNSISLIPFEMFDANSNLEDLNLSFNRLSTVMFGLQKLRKLGILDLSGNQIQVVEGRHLTQLQEYMTTMQHNYIIVKLILDDNPLECTCKSVSFIDWLTKLTALNHSNSYFCNYKGELQRVDQSAVDGSKYLCVRNMITAVSISMTSVLILVGIGVASVLIKIHRKRKRIDSEYQFCQEFNGQNMAEEFMVFLAYASVDEDMVRNHVIFPINDTLKARLGTIRDVLATGYKFRPGFRIAEETFRLIKLSHVFVAVVSNSFCRSKYSIGELHEACTQEKPVILVFCGEVDENDMSPYLREIFKRVVRAKLVAGGNGSMEIIPSVENICESVIMLAMKRYK